MEENENKDIINSFIRIGIIVLTVVVVFALGLNYMPQAISVTSKSTKKLPIYCVNTEKRQVAISFDAAWGNDQTQGILDCLEKYKVKSTFFLTGGWIDNYGDDVKRIARAGHDIGNHSQNHKQMSRISKEECMKEITQVHNKVKTLTGKDIFLFRPPFGDYNNTLINVCNELNYYCIQWDVDSLDWKDYDARTIANRVLKDKHLGNGSIILFHNGGKHTLEALPAVIEGLQAKGYEIVPISQLIYKDNYEMDHEGRQFKK